MPPAISDLSLILVYSIYGLAFFSMGLIMLMELNRSPILADTHVLRPLAIFGFLHGIHEWLEMLLIEAARLGVPISAGLTADLSFIRLFLLVSSFSSLLAFGLYILRPGKTVGIVELLIGLSLLLVYAILLAVTFLSRGDPFNVRILHADALARYLLAVPAAFIAAVALLIRASEARRIHLRGLAACLAIAAACFGLYSLTQVFVPAGDIFPTTVLNSSVFLAATGIPVQVLRAGLAVGSTVSLLQATQLADVERKRQFLEAQQARLAAIDQLQQELIEREALRRELLRHTVIAQEDERSRIARELHDETAQLLTAISLNLAALKSSIQASPRAEEIIGRLQGLIRQMSQSIYLLVHDLRPAQLDDLGLVAALQYLGDEERKRVGLTVRLEVEGPRRRLDPLVETVFFRVAQEALTNVARHAGVSEAEMTLQFTAAAARLRICDQGAGFDLHASLIPPHGWGLAGMRERAESVGGELTIRSSPGGGTVIEVEVPFQAGGKGEKETAV